MKYYPPQFTNRCAAWSALLPVLAGLALGTARADTIIQTVNQGTANATGWLAPIWGTPADVPMAGNVYVVPSGFTLRTPNYNTNMTFPGNLLVITNGGTLALKHSGGAVNVNLVLGPGTINHFGGVGTTGVPPSPFTGTINVVANANLTATGTTTPQPRHIELRSTLSGTGNFTVNVWTNAVYLSGDASGYSGNWNVTGGRLEVWSGSATPLGSGTITLNDATNTLTFNTTNEVLVPNAISGGGGINKLGTGTVTLSGANTFFGPLAVRDGTLIVGSANPGNPSGTLVTSTGVLRLGHAAPLGYAAITVDGNNAMTARLELSNNVTVQTFNPMVVSMRNNASPAIVSVGGNNVIADPINITAGGGQLYIEANPGSSLELRGEVSSAATGARNFTLQGGGTGLVTGAIANGNATTLTLNKAGIGTWTLAGYNTYTGNTVISGGTLKLAAGGSIGSTPILQIDAGAVLDASASGLPLSGLGTPQTLRGSGAVVGNITTTPGSFIEVALANQTGSLSFSNHLILGGDDALRFDVASGSNDVLNVTGNVVLNGFTTNIVNILGGFVDNGSYRLINYGGTLQGSGSFVLTHPTSRQTFALDLSTPHQVNLVVTGNPIELGWSGDGLLNAWDVGTTPNWDSGTSVFYNADYVTFTDSGSAVPDIDVTTPVQVSSMVVSNVTKDFTFVNTNGISTVGSLTKKGAGKVAFANANNAISGPITIAEGTLQIGNGDVNGSLGSGAILNQAALVMNKSSNNGALLGGVLSGPGSLTIQSGSLQLLGANTYTGPTVIETGDISIRNNQALGDPATGTVVHDGGSVRFGNLGNWVVNEPLSLVGEGYAAFPGALYANTISNVATWAGPVTLTGPTRFRAVNNYVQLNLANTVLGDQTPLRVSSEGTGTRVAFQNTLNLGNTAPLTKDGSGAIILAGGTNIAGGTLVNAGTLQILSTNHPQIGDVTMAAGTLQIGDGGFTGALPTGLIDLVAAGSVFTVTSSNTLTLDQQVVGAGRMTKVGYGKLIINSSNTFAGNLATGSGTPTTGGTILLRNSFGLGDEFAFKTVQIIRTELQLENNLTLPAGITLETSGNSGVNDVGIRLIPVRSLSGNNVIQGNISMTGGAGDSELAVDSGTLTVNGGISANTTSLRTMRLSGAGTGTLNGAINNGTTTAGLLKTGAGTWHLNAASFYTGATVVQEGTLILGPGVTLPGTPSIELRSNAVLNATAAGGLTVDAAQVLRGAGIVQGSVTAYGQVSPGLPIGTLLVSGAVSLQGTTLMEINRTNTPLNADLLSAASIAFGGELIVTNAGPALQGGEVFNLFDGTLSGAFAVVTLPTLPDPRLTWNTTQLATQGIIKVDGGQAPPFTLNPPTVSGTNLVFQFTSEAGYNYYLERTASLAPANWSVLSTNAGGGVITLEIPINPARPQEYFRVRGGL